LNSRARKAATLLLPPLAVSITRRTVRRIRSDLPEWEYVGPAWPDEGGPGWTHRTVAETQRAKWSQFVSMARTPGPLGIAHEAVRLSRDDIVAHNSVMSYGYVLSRASRLQNPLRVLDWGSGQGHYYVFARQLVPDIQLQYTCVDLPAFREGVEALLPEVTFLPSPAQLAPRSYDLVMASTSLQYDRDWRALVARLFAASDKYLYITGLPLLENGSSYVSMQRPSRYGYETIYLNWCLARAEFEDHVANLGGRIEREFVVSDEIPIARASVRPRYRGFLIAVPERNAEGVI
jgi:putative methyltransferase (TIGR04325 family)